MQMTSDIDCKQCEHNWNVTIDLGEESSKDFEAACPKCGDKDEYIAMKGFSSNEADG